MKKTLLLLFSVIVTLYGIDQQTRAWVINYLKGTGSTIDTVYMHYTDSLNVPILIVDNYIDGDSANFDHAVVNVHLYCDSAWFDDVVANWGVIDTLECEFLFMDSAGDSVWLYPNKFIMFNDSASQRDSIYWDTDRMIWKKHQPIDLQEIILRDINTITLRDSSNMNLIIGRRDSTASFGSKLDYSPCTLLIWTNVDANPSGGVPLHPGFYRIYTNSDSSITYTSTDKGALIIDAPEITDETADNYGQIILDASNVDLRSSTWRNSPGDTPGRIALRVTPGYADTVDFIVGNTLPGQYSIYGKSKAVQFTILSGASDQDTLTWRMYDPGGVSQMMLTKDTAGINLDTTFVRGGVLHAKDSILTAQFNATNSTVDSVDAQHGVFDVSLQGDSANFNHLMAGQLEVGNVDANLNATAKARGITISHSSIPSFYFKDNNEGANDKLFVITYDAENLGFHSLNDIGTAYDFENILVINRDGHITIAADLTVDSIDAPHGVIDTLIVDSLDAKKITVDTMHYATTVDKSIQISVTLPRLGTGAPPAVGVEDQFKTLDFDKATDEDVFFQIDLPSDYKTAGAIEIEVCFFVDGTVTGDTFVVWGCEYKTITHENAEVFDFDAGTATKLDTMTLSSGEAAKLYRESVISLVTTGFLVSDLLLCRIYRDADNAKDDYDGGDARAVHFEMLYESDKPGRYN